MPLRNKVSSIKNEQKIGKPVLLNPNSFENNVKIISSLKSNLEIGHTCRWTVVGWDGQPYCLAMHIKEHDPTSYDWIHLVVLFK